MVDEDWLIHPLVVHLCRRLIGIVPYDVSSVKDEYKSVVCQSWWSLGISGRRSYVQANQGGKSAWSIGLYRFLLNCDMLGAIGCGFFFSHISVLVAASWSVKTNVDIFSTKIFTTNTFFPSIPILLTTLVCVLLSGSDVTPRHLRCTWTWIRIRY